MHYGIDLGTTNSAIARCDGASAALVTAPDGASLLLPSVVHIDAGGRLTVGAAAHAQQAGDPLNTASEFKRLMGTAELRTFPNSGRRLSAEALSAAVLRELAGWAAATGGPRPEAAVITVPAMFQLPQCDATRRAAAEAGIEHAVLLQEPIAAALCHAGSGGHRDGHWMVYDLGGGTFDVSLIRSRGGRLQIVDHDGDNHLGGRDFDRALARRAAEIVRATGALGEFRRADPKFAPAFALLKVEAERVRLALSVEEQVSFRVDALATDPAGDPVGVEFLIDRSQLDELLYPLILRTTALCKKMLGRVDLRRAPIRGLVLVGGPTRTPLLPAVLADELGVEPQPSDDPMTIVARGAALFAATQRSQASSRRRVADAPTTLELQLEYETMTTNPRPLIVGRLDRSRVPAGCSVHIAGGAGPATSARVAEDGTFQAEVALRPGAANRLQLSVLDPRSERLPAEPSEVTIIHGVSMARPPLSQSVGVLLADNTPCIYLKKGAVLPARNTKTHTTTTALRRGQSGEAISVPLLQGESARGDRNKVIGVLRIYAENIARDLPRGSEVIVTLGIDEFSQTQASAYVPLLDQTFNRVVSFDLELKAAAEVQHGLTAQRDRLAALEQLADGLGEAAPGELDARVREVEDLLDEGDRDSVDLADQLVRSLADELDQVEGDSPGASWQAETEATVSEARELIASLGKPEDWRMLAALAGEIESALARVDEARARAHAAEVSALQFEVLSRHPEFWKGFFEHLAAQIERHGLTAAAATALRRGQRALGGGDIRVQELLLACRELMQLLPENIQAEAQAASVALVSNIR